MIGKDKIEMLDAALPRERVAHRSQAGHELSYVEGWWVISELNRIFGQGWWSYDATDTREVDRELDEKGRWCVSYACRARLTVRRGGGCDVVDTVTIGDVGHGHGVDKRAGIAVESAEKEAATDALKRCAKSLGFRLGLALYDKTQEHVADVPEERATPTEEARIERDWDAMSEADKRASWPQLSAEARARIKARKEQSK